MKNLSCAARNRFHRSASASRSARPAAFHLFISSRYSLVVGPQSVDPDSASASVTSFSLRALTSSRSDSRLAKKALRRLVNALRAADSRFHSAASAARSACGAAFLLEQLAHPLAAALPVGGFRGDLLSLGDDPARR